MKKHISYPKIDQFRGVVRTINNQIGYVGQDENDNPIYDSTIPKPTIRFTGMVKLHGTNASVCFNKQDGFWAQSRNNIITPEKDNAGFAFFAETRRESIVKIFNTLASNNDIDFREYTLSLYGEWAGKGIQKGVAISELDKAFYIFGAKISKPQDEKFISYWVGTTDLRDIENKIYNIEDFPTFIIDVDFNMPQLSQNEFIRITEEVERECPVAKQLGVSGIGEGVVWSSYYEGTEHRFKVKGEKHSVTKVKKLASVDIEKLESIQKFVEYAVTENRFEQAIKEVFGTDSLDIKKLGDVIRWTINDVISEEMDTMSENNLEPRDLNRYVALKVKEFFNKKL